MNNFERRTAEHIVDVPQFAEETVVVPGEQVQQRTAEHIEDVPQFAEETVKVVRLVAQERVQWTDEQLVREVFDMFTS